MCVNVDVCVDVFVCVCARLHRAHLLVHALGPRRHQKGVSRDQQVPRHKVHHLAPEVLGRGQGVSAVRYATCAYAVRCYASRPTPASSMPSTAMISLGNCTRWGESWGCSDGMGGAGLRRGRY